MSDQRRHTEDDLNDSIDLLCLPYNPERAAAAKKKITPQRLPALPAALQNRAPAKRSPLTKYLDRWADEPIGAAADPTAQPKSAAAQQERPMHIGGSIPRGPSER